MKRRNPRFGYQRIADQISLAFDIPVDKDTVRRVLVTHYRPDPGSGGPSWLTFLGHSKDSLWSLDPFRCKSLVLKTHWVMVAMDQFTRRIVGFAYVPISHPFVERLIGTIRREYLDQVPFWNARDLENKLSCFQDYYNCQRAHQGIGGTIPEPEFDDTTRNIASLDNYRWLSCCRGLYQLPAAA